MAEPYDVGNDERADVMAINTGGLRERLVAAVDHALLHMNGDRDELAHQDHDHDDVARAAADAVMAVIEDEAIDRMAETLVAESRMRALDFRNGVKMEVEPARELAAAWVAAARAMLGDAPNYAETPVEMETGLAGERERFAFTLQRVGKVTPHEARRAAEEERDAARATIADVYRWLVDDLGYGLETHTSPRPPWLDVRRLADEWRRHENAESEPVEDWVALIHQETGWPEAEGGAP